MLCTHDSPNKHKLGCLGKYYHSGVNITCHYHMSYYILIHADAGIVVESENHCNIIPIEAHYLHKSWNIIIETIGNYLTTHLHLNNNYRNAKLVI